MQPVARSTLKGAGRYLGRRPPLGARSVWSRHRSPQRGRRGALGRGGGLRPCSGSRAARVPGSGTRPGPLPGAAGRWVRPPGLRPRRCDPSLGPRRAGQAPGTPSEGGGGGSGLRLGLGHAPRREARRGGRGLSRALGRQLRGPALGKLRSRLPPAPSSRPSRRAPMLRPRSGLCPEGSRRTVSVAAAEDWLLSGALGWGACGAQGSEASAFLTSF